VHRKSDALPPHASAIILKALVLSFHDVFLAAIPFAALALVFCFLLKEVPLRVLRAKWRKARPWECSACKNAHVLACGQMLVDDVTIHVEAGSGGRGAVAFNKVRLMQGPTGADGGQGWQRLL
jgi:hypothetical protein